MQVAMGDVNFQPTAASCLPYQCGADQGNFADIYACSIAGFSAAKGCNDPTCQPYCPNAAITPYLQPPPQPPATPSAPAQPTTRLTSLNITQPVPDITRVLQPVIVNPCPTDAWSEINQFIGDNPLTAIAAAAAAYFLLARRK